MADGTRRAALRQAVSPACARRSLAVAAVVGTVLNLINQGDVLMAGGGLNYVKIALTYAVPFCVATYGAWSMALISARLRERRQPSGRAVRQRGG
jgi:hypothetical protein